MTKHSLSDDAQLIDRAGGVSAIAKATGYSVQRVQNWKTRGIPAAARVEFPELFWPRAEDATTSSSDLPRAGARLCIDAARPSSEEGVS